ncbi:MAG: mitochondrial import inner membrane translocase subunit Tim22 [Amphiamblys sp. WSBS2006]|nr:MAG: mitochondrial import inner membrane translocase subunit Tim22 [Amphiamblys sp. WSBS2006]
MIQIRRGDKDGAKKGEDNSAETQPSRVGSWITKKIRRMTTRKNLEYARQSCLFHVAASTVSGFMFGGTVGLFFSAASVLQDPLGEGYENSPVSVQARLIAKRAGVQTLSSARSFALVSAANTAAECLVDRVNMRRGVVRAMVTGCITGGIGCIGKGRRAVLTGCATFGLFSALAASVPKHIRVKIT